MFCVEYVEIMRLVVTKTRSNNMRRSIIMGIFTWMLAVSASTQAEVLVYNLTASEKVFELVNDAWTASTQKSTGYLVFDVDYDSQGVSILTSAWDISYWKNGTEKWFEGRENTELAIARAPVGKTLNWIAVYNEWMDGDQGDFAILTGTGKSTSIGTATKKEVASSLSGYIVSLSAQGSQENPEELEIRRGTVSAKLNSTWTKWANDTTKGNQSLDDTVEMIKTYLISKGYQEVVE